MSVGNTFSNTSITDVSSSFNVDNSNRISLRPKQLSRFASKKRVKQCKNIRRKKTVKNLIDRISSYLIGTESKSMIVGIYCYLEVNGITPKHKAQEKCAKALSHSKPSLLVKQHLQSMVPFHISINQLQKMHDHFAIRRRMLNRKDFWSVESDQEMVASEEEDSECEESEDEETEISDKELVAEEESNHNVLRLDEEESESTEKELTADKKSSDSAPRSDDKTGNEPYSDTTISAEQQKEFDRLAARYLRPNKKYL